MDFFHLDYPFLSARITGDPVLIKYLCLGGNFWCGIISKAKVEILLQPLFICLSFYFLKPCRASLAETY